MRKVLARVFPLVVVSLATLPLSSQVQGVWTTTGSSQDARELNAQVALGTGALSIGGTDGLTILPSAELYNSKTGTWSLTGSMTAGRESFPAVVLQTGKVLVVGGLGTGSTVLAEAELYDPATGTWSSAGSLSVARFGHTATLLGNGKVLVAGGCGANDCSVDTAVSELYDPASNSWSATGNLNTTRHYHTAVRLKTGRVLVIGGSTGAASNSCEMYDPAKGTWSNAASTNVVRYLNTTTLLPDGKVLVTGGTPSRVPLNSAELYDPASNTWTLTGSMTIGRYAHTATLLGDGTVVVAGGVGQSISCGKDCTGYIPTAKVDIYNEATGKFIAGANLSRARAHHFTTLVKPGRALASGGMGTTSICCVVLNTAEFYTPLSLTFSAFSLNFGFEQVGVTTQAQTVTVTNVSNHPVTFASVTASGDYAAPSDCSGTLAPTQACTLNINFTPTIAGSRGGAVTLMDDSPGNPKQTIKLSGVGEVNAISFSPATLKFPGQTPGTSSLLSVMLINDGTTPVNIGAIAISPVRKTFTQSNNCPATLNVNQSCVVQVVFTPPDTGKYSSTLSVTDSAAGSPQSMAITGTGLNN